MKIYKTIFFIKNVFNKVKSVFKVSLFFQFLLSYFYKILLSTFFINIIKHIFYMKNFILFKLLCN